MSRFTEPPILDELAPKPLRLFGFLRRTIVEPLIFTGRFRANTQVTKHGDIATLKNNPALIISNHGSMFDFPNIDKACYPEVPPYLTCIGEFIGIQYFFLRRFGNFPKRRFTLDFNVLRSMKKILNEYKRSVAFFPESRFSFAGIPEYIDEGVGKLIKFLKKRVIIINQKGSFLTSPQWNKHPYKIVPNFVDVYEIKEDEVMSSTAEELQAKVVKLLQYNEYKFYNEKGIKSKNEIRCKHLDQILYKCPVCGEEFKMDAGGTKIWCKHCGAEWEMNENYELVQKDGESKFKFVPDWWKWEQEVSIKENETKPYRFEDDVELYHLDSFKKGFVRKGRVHMIYDKDGLRLNGTLDSGEEFNFLKECKNTPDIHLEMNFLGEGLHAIDVVTNTDSWYCYPVNKEKEVIKLDWMGRILYEQSKGN